MLLFCVIQADPVNIEKSIDASDKAAGNGRAVGCNEHGNCWETPQNCWFDENGHKLCVGK